MKKISFWASALFLSATILASCSDAPKSEEAKVTDSVAVQEVAAAQDVAIDVANSKITWIGTKPTGKHNGELKLSTGSLKIENGAIVGGSFDIDINSITVLDMPATDEGNAKLTGHLKSHDFFEVEKFPTAKFEITEVKAFDAAAAPADENPNVDGSLKIANPTHIISGNLTLKGVTKNVTFSAKVSTEGGISAQANFNIDRTQWGLSYNAEGSVPDKFIHNKMNIGLDIKATPAN